MIDTGQGSPIVLIPGLQGRWEWMTPTVEALSAHHRTFSFSLDDVDAVKAPERAFDAWVAEIDRLLDHAGEKQAAIAGVSFGGLVAAYYAARRPNRTSALVLISVPAPRWQWDHPMAKYVSRPRLAFPTLHGARGGPLVSGVQGAGRAPGTEDPVSDAASGPRDAIPGLTDVHGRVCPRLGRHGHHARNVAVSPRPRSSSQASPISIASCPLARRWSTRLSFAALVT